jgi:PilZ domain
MAISDPRTLLAALSKLESIRDPSAGKNLRQYVRFVVRGEAELQPLERDRLDQRPVSALMRDLSRGGLGFVCQEELPVGSLWRAGFMHQDHVVTQQAMIIRHGRRVQENLFLYGGQFVLDTATMVLQGIEPSKIRDGDQTQRNEPNSFVSPSEVK